VEKLLGAEFWILTWTNFMGPNLAFSSNCYTPTETNCITVIACQCLYQLLGKFKDRWAIYQWLVFSGAISANWSLV